MRQASKRKRASKKEDAAPAEVALDADITPEEMQMMQAMGIPFVSCHTAFLGAVATPHRWCAVAAFHNARNTALSWTLFESRASFANRS